MQATLEQMQADERTTDLAVSLALAEQSNQRLVLVVDQFEELFSLCSNEDERRAFLANLTYAATIPGGRLMVVAALRADFYHHCATYPELRSLVAAHQFLAGSLSPDGLRRAIVEPARRVGLGLEAGLVEAILADVADRPGNLPLLEHALFELWEARQDHLLTVEAYVAQGRVEGAVAKRADATYQSFSPAHQQVARRVFLRLTQPEEGAKDTRRRATIKELVTHPGDEDDINAVVTSLVDRRLLTTSHDELAGAAVVELAHEALIRAWPTLRAWIAEDREALRAHRRLSEAANDWDRAGRDEELLYRGSRLAYWTERDPSDLNDLERTFLDTSRQRLERERARTRRRIRFTVGSLSLALIVITAVAGFALVQRNRVADQRDLALSRQLAASATNQLQIDPERSLLLAIEALTVKPTKEAESILRQAVVDSAVRTRFTGHRGIVWGAAFSPDGRRVVSAGEDGTVRVWTLTEDARPIVLKGHQGGVNSAAFSPDGDRIVSAGADGTVRVWEWAGGGGEPVILRGHQGAVLSATFSPDGRRVVSAGQDGTVRVWMWDRGNETMVLRGHQGEVFDVAFSPDGQRVVSAGNDGTVRVWTLNASAKPVVLRNHQRDVKSVAFSPNGGQIVSAGEDGTVRVWTLTGDVEPIVLRGHRGSVWDASFSPDGRQVASAGADGTVRVWEWAEGAEPTVLRGHQNAVAGVDFSPDGRRVVSGGLDGTVRVWRCDVCRPTKDAQSSARTRVTRRLPSEERLTF